MKILDIEREILDGLKSGLAESIRIKVASHSGKVGMLVDEVIGNHSAAIKELMESAISREISSNDFRDAVNNAFTHKLARALIEKLEGSIDRRVNELKNDPVIKAKMLLAIESLIIKL